MNGESEFSSRAFLLWVPKPLRVGTLTLGFSFKTANLKPLVGPSPPRGLVKLQVSGGRYPGGSDSVGPGWGLSIPFLTSSQMRPVWRHTLRPKALTHASCWTNGPGARLLPGALGSGELSSRERLLRKIAEPSPGGILGTQV